jgi:hypothetical protein
MFVPAPVPIDNLYPLPAVAAVAATVIEAVKVDVPAVVTV